jgi:hypothetical protein
MNKGEEGYVLPATSFPVSSRALCLLPHAAWCLLPHAAWCLLPHAAVAQITTGTVTGRVADSSGAVIPRAHAVPISEAQGTRSAVVETKDSGDYMFPNVTPDTYTVEVTAPAFKTTRETGILVTGLDRTETQQRSGEEAAE